MRRPPRPHFLSVFWLHLSQHLSTYLSSSVFLHLPVTGLIVKAFFLGSALSGSPLVSPAVSSFMLALMFLFGIQAEHSSDSVTLVRLRGLTSSHIRPKFRLEYFVSAATSLQREKKSLPLINLMGRLDCLLNTGRHFCTKSSAWVLLFLTWDTKSAPFHIWDS